MRLKKFRPADQPAQGATSDGPPGEEEVIDDALAKQVESSDSETVGPDGIGQQGDSTGRVRWTNVVGAVVLPGLALALAAGAGFLKWQDTSLRSTEIDGAASVRAATDATISLLSYKPETVEQDLERGRTGLTGAFLDAYTSLTKDVVIPGAKKKQISAVATVPAAASVSATPGHAVALLFVNQTLIIGNDAPTGTSSSVRVTLDKVGGRWLISGFDPV